MLKNIHVQAKSALLTRKDANVTKHNQFVEGAPENQDCIAFGLMNQAQSLLERPGNMLSNIKRLSSLIVPWMNMTTISELSSLHIFS